MKTALLLCVLLIPVATWAGTFKDDFNDDNLDGWSIHTEVGEVEVRNGQVIATDPIFWDILTTGISFNNGQELSNYRMSFDGNLVRAIDKAQGNIVSIYVGFRNHEDISLMAALEPGMARLVLVLLKINGFIQIGRKELPFAMERDKWYRIDAEVEDGKVSVSVDGNLIGGGDWTGHPWLPEKGSVMIGAGGSEVHIDNFIITGDEIPDMAVQPGHKLAVTWAVVKKAKP